MGSLNRKTIVINKTHGGAVADVINNIRILRRSVLSCLLWENEFYEDGQTIADRILNVASLCRADDVADLAIEARRVHGLRHVPLLLLVDLLSRDPKTLPPGMIKHTIFNTINRVDEMMELVAICNKYRKVRPLIFRHALKKGLADCFHKFDEYQFAKYNRDTAIKLRDVMFLCHPKPRDEAQARLFKKIAQNQLDVPDTWETSLSAGKDKKATFERLIAENKLGYLALLRNLRNMVQAGCNEELVASAILARKGAQMVFPFRYIAAARYAPMYEKYIDQAFQAAIKEIPAFTGRTLVLVDVSDSMNHRLSTRSDLTRMDAAAALATIIPDDKRVFTFSRQVMEVPSRSGMAGIDAIVRSQQHLGTNTTLAMNQINKIPHDRLILITDEQSTSSGRLPQPIANKAYGINVGSARNGITYSKGWTLHLDGFSESVIKYISAYENEFLK
jgi:60 kDa SS-A/Ro ribonucleoprotein